MTNFLHSKAYDSLLGLYIGDALAMPVHWYYNRQALIKDYGRVTDYLAPHNPHPGGCRSGSYLSGFKIPS